MLFAQIFLIPLHSYPAETTDELLVVSDSNRTRHNLLVSIKSTINVCRKLCYMNAYIPPLKLSKTEIHSSWECLLTRIYKIVRLSVFLSWRSTAQKKTWWRKFFRLILPGLDLSMFFILITREKFNHFCRIWLEAFLLFIVKAKEQGKMNQLLNAFFLSKMS